jgi:hypothetical protein
MTGVELIAERSGAMPKHIQTLGAVLIVVLMGVWVELAWAGQPGTSPPNWGLP